MFATANLGFGPSGKRIVKRGSGKTKTEAKNKLKEVLRDHEDGRAIPPLGARKLRDLSAEDVDRWLAAKAKTLSTRTLQSIHSCLNRSVKRVMARER